MQFWERLPKEIPAVMEDANIDYRSTQCSVYEPGDQLIQDIKRIVQSHLDSLDEDKGGVATLVKHHRDNCYVVAVNGMSWCEKGKCYHSSGGKTAYYVDVDRGEFWPVCQAGSCKEKPAPTRIAHEIHLFKFLRESDIGWARITVTTLQDIIKVTDRKSREAYVYNDYNGLWERKYEYGVLPTISKSLSGVIDRFTQHIKKGNHSENDMEKLMKMCEELRRSAFCTSKLLAAYKLAAHDLYSENFEDQLTKKYNHLWPMREKKVLNLKTGEISELRKEHMFNFVGPCNYIHKTSYPKIEKLVSSIMCGNPSTIKYLRLKMGLLLTGELLREVDNFLGDGSNGKSSLYKLIQCVMGKFFTLLPREIVIKAPGSSQGSASPQWMTVIHARAAFFDEVEDDEKVDARNVKTMSNGDPRKFRGLFKSDYQTVHPRCKIIICTNKELAYDSTDKAMEDRLITTPFPANFEKKTREGSHDQKRDDFFIDDIKQNHLDDLFSYMVDAAIDFYKGGKQIDRPKEVIELTAKINNDMNTVKQFVDARCSLRPSHERAPEAFKDEKYSVRPGTLFHEYTSYIQLQHKEAKKACRHPNSLSGFFRGLPLLLRSGGLESTSPPPPPASPPWGCCSSYEKV
jgi:phage/plasmid-associated DNA primase